MKYYAEIFDSNGFMRVTSSMEDMFDTKEEAIQWAKHCLGGDSGYYEIREGENLRDVRARVDAMVKKMFESGEIFKAWSQELQDKTFEILNDPDRVLGWSMLPNKSGVFKRTNGQYGFMKFENAVSKNWIIDLEDGSSETFESINDLLKAGWVLD